MDLTASSIGFRPWSSTILGRSRGSVPSLLPVRCSVFALHGDQEYVLAIDVGTSGTKAALVSSRGRVAASAVSPHPAPAPSVRGGQASVEQDPRSWWSATKSAVKKCLANTLLKEHEAHSSPIQAVAVTGQMQDLILMPQVELDSKRQAILYSDARATGEANEIAEMAGGEISLASSAGYPQGATSLLAKLRWLDKYDPEAFHNCQIVLLGGHDYVAWKLSQACITDATTASTTGLTDTTFQYAASLLKTLKLDHWLDKLPPIMPADIPCGEVSKTAAEELGQPELVGIPVLHCCGDNGACSIGAGAGVPGSMYAYLGTSGWVAGSFMQALEDEVIHFAPGLFSLAHPDPSLIFKSGAIMTAGGNMEWAVSNLQIPGIGERCPFEDSEARAAFIGISSTTSSCDMFRSVMEGVSFSLRSARDAIRSPCDLGPLRLVGGGARSPLWPSIIANVFGQSVEVLEDAQNAGVKGAALLAGKWLGWHASLSPNGDWLRVKRTFHPCPSDVEIYKSLFGAYTKSYVNLKETFKILRNVAKAQ